MASVDCRKLLCCGIFIAFVFLLAVAEGRTKKVVIHVPYKVKRIKHTHTVYKTIHHHHHDRLPLDSLHHIPAATEEHEHFHHMHIHEEPIGNDHHPSVPIPEFLPPDAHMELPLDIPDLPLDVSAIPKRHMMPLYRRA